MTQEKFNDVVGSQIEFCKSMLIKKGTEYAPENHAPGEMDRLAHFKKAAMMMNCTLLYKNHRVPMLHLRNS